MIKERGNAFVLLDWSVPGKIVMAVHYISKVGLESQEQKKKSNYKVKR